MSPTRVPVGPAHRAIVTAAPELAHCAVLRIAKTLALGTTLVAPAVLAAPSALAAQRVPAPSEQFGFEPGAHRELADWDQLVGYYETLARTSPRVTIDTLGPTTMGRPFVMLTITSEANQARVDELHEIQRRLSDPRTVSGDAELERLLAQGRTIVMITHNIHSTEVGSAQVAPRLLHRLATSNDPDVLEVLENVVLLDIPSLNPDGTDWVSEWYMQHVDSEFEGSSPPWLYHYYVGHDNNRDWYAFTQLETQHTVAAQNAWHPQIVHDIHQMGGGGARIFFPPYIDPVERNVDPAIVSALNQLGSWMAASLTAQGKAGAVINAIYDAFSPARAYMHYHGAVRILSETASARLATPVTQDDPGGGREYEATASWKHPLPWSGGEWGLPDIVDYMEAGAFALLQNAARNRRFWLENFWHINQRAVDGWPSWPVAWAIPADQANTSGLSYLLRSLTLGDVEVRRASAAFRAAGTQFPAGTYVVAMNQPYASFAQTLLERQEYPDLREYPGGPPKRPYDVTAHTLPLLLDVEAVRVERWDGTAPALSDAIPDQSFRFALPAGLQSASAPGGSAAPRVALYKSAQEPMEAGWTRWVFDQHELAYDTLKDVRVRRGDLRQDYDVIVLQSQSPGSIVDGNRPGSLPAQYTGGIGEEGAAAITEFVRAGGRLIAIEEATEFAIDQFGLAVSNGVDGLDPQDFYVPGSILRVDLDASHPISEGLGDAAHVWYWGDSRAFDVADPAVRVVARYGAGNPAVSGWILGPEHLAGKPALLEASVGAGSVVLFGFQPNYRAQSAATWPLLWNALGG